MRKFHLTSEIIFSLYGEEKEEARYAFSFDLKNLLNNSLFYLTQVKKLLSFAGLNFYKGRYLWKGDHYPHKREVILSNAGTFSPDTAIGTELLCFLGAEYLIRVGCCGSLREDINIGDLVVVDRVLDDTGVTKFYPCQIKIDQRLNERIKNVFSSQFKVFRGMVWSFDALFREEEKLVKKKRRKGAIVVDMAVAAFFKVASFYNRKAASVLIVSDNLSTGEIGFKSKFYHNQLQRLIKKLFSVLEVVEEF